MSPLLSRFHCPDEPAIGQADGPVAAPGHPGIMRDEQPGRAAGVDLTGQEVDDGLASFGIEARRRLVHQQDGTCAGAPGRPAITPMAATSTAPAEWSP
jgi:hypothetical protein